MEKGLALQSAQDLTEPSSGRLAFGYRTGEAGTKSV